MSLCQFRCVKAPRHFVPVPLPAPLLYLSISSFMQPQDHKGRHNESRAACLFHQRVTIPFSSGQFLGMSARQLVYQTPTRSLGVAERNGSSVQAEGGRKCRILLWQQSIVRTDEINYKTVPLLMCLKLREVNLGTATGLQEPHLWGKAG